jgi:hypothetical protein
MIICVYANSSSSSSSSPNGIKRFPSVRYSKHAQYLTNATPNLEERTGIPCASALLAFLSLILIGFEATLEWVTKAFRLLDCACGE